MLEEVYEQLRRHQPPAPEATEAVADVACPLPHRTRPRWQFWTAQAVALLLAAAAGAFGYRLAVPPPDPACADEGGKVWWHNDPRVADPGKDPRGFRSSARGGSQDPWDLYVARSCVDIVQGRKYVLAFAASASMPVTITVRVQDKRPPQYAASLDERVTLKPEPQQFTYPSSGALTTPESELLFQLGGHPADFRLEVSGLSLTAR